MSKAGFGADAKDRTPPHLDTSPTRVSKSREAVCRNCEARVTQTLDGEEEYGHKPTCRYSIRKRDDHALEWRGPPEDEQ